MPVYVTTLFTRANSQATQMCTKRRMHKWNRLYTQNRISFDFLKNYDTCYKLVELWGHFLHEIRQSQKDKYSVILFIWDNWSQSNRDRKVECWFLEARGRRKWRAIVHEYGVSVLQQVLEMDVDDTCITM